MKQIDCFSIFRNTITIEGTSDCGVPKLRYGDAIPQQCAEITGKRYKLIAVVWEDQISNDAITLTFEREGSVFRPKDLFNDPYDGYSEIGNHFNELLSKGGRALEIGSRERSGNSYRAMFPSNVEYVGLDITAGPNVDVVGDAHKLGSTVDGKFDFVFSISVFEHLLMPWVVALEMNKVMNDGGHALIISHAAWPLHDEPWDFWRFSKESWNGIFNAHTGFRVVKTGYANRSWTVPNFSDSSTVQGMDTCPSYLISACLVQKSGNSKVGWDADVAGIYDLNYSHDH